MQKVSAETHSSANGISINPVYIVKNKDSSFILAEDGQKTLSDAEKLVEQADAKQIRVFLKPEIHALDKTNPDIFKPENIDKFFASYKEQLLLLAKMAEAHHVAAFSIGNELANLSGSAYRTQWLDLIDDIRAVYSGKLTYSAASYEMKDVAFWDKLDYVGVIALATVDGKTPPTTEQLIHEWTQQHSNAVINSSYNGKSFIDFIHEFSTLTGKQVFITGLEYKRIDDHPPGEWVTVASGNSKLQAMIHDTFEKIWSEQGKWAENSLSQSAAGQSGTYMHAGGGFETPADNLTTSLNRDYSALGPTLHTGVTDHPVFARSIENPILSSGGHANIPTAQPEASTDLFHFNKLFQGISFDSGANNTFSTLIAKQTLDKVVDVNANAVSIVATYRIATGTSSKVFENPTRTESLANYDAAIKDAHARGLAVMVKPHINADDSTFSGSLAPADINAFFASYKSNLMDLARVAEANHAELFSVGNELTSLTGSAYRSYWVDIIDSVRTVYSGNLTYSGTFYGEENVSFWDKVDYIGVNAYLPLSNKTDPTFDEMMEGWASTYNSTRAFNLFHGQSFIDFMHDLSTATGKQVIVTELGYRSVDGAALYPGDWQTVQPVNYAQQEKLYQAFFKAWGVQGDWFQGAFFWDWHANGNSPADDFTTLGKPANDVIADAFDGTDGHSSLPDGNATTITVHASGREIFNIAPIMMIALDGLFLGTVSVTEAHASNQWGDYTFTTGYADPSRLQIYFANSEFDSVQLGRNLFIDWIEVNGKTYQAEAFGIINTSDTSGNPVTTYASMYSTYGVLTLDLNHGVSDNDYTVHHASVGGETFTGTAGADYVDLHGGANTIDGGDGNDVIDGFLAGASILSGGTGNDVIKGSTGNDTITTGEGYDRIIVVDNGGTDHVTDFSVAYDVLDFTFAAAATSDLQISNTVLGGISGTAVTYFNSTVFLEGVTANTLSAANFQFFDKSSAGSSIFGTSSADTLQGGDTADFIYGNNGNDVLIGKGGADILYGGLGADTFQFEAATAFASVDKINDFNTGQGDKLDISAILTGYDPFTSLIHDFVSLTTSGGNTTVLVDRDGTGTAYAAQAVATLTGVTGLDVDNMLSNGNLIA